MNDAVVTQDHQWDAATGVDMPSAAFLKWLRP